MDESTLQQLLQPRSFKHATGAIVLRETHISWVILSGEFAYKIKKPVNFGFLDFSTLAQRRYFCEQELELNRRFAPELYLAVVAVTDDGEGPCFEGAGAVIDYAVKMRRFDEEQLLDNIAARGELDRTLVRSLARELARQQMKAPVCHPRPGSEQPGSAATLLSAMQQNFEQASAYDLAPPHRKRLAYLRQWTLQGHDEQLALLQQRAARGKVVDGHGDAHLGNIALINGAVRLFDCIEFNPALRVMDSIGEIALLTMDLQARGHSPQSHWLLADYLEYSGDYEGLALLQLYRCYFGMVRAKVALLRESVTHTAIQGTEAYSDFSRYLALAGTYCQPGARFLAITHGVSGSGKSTVADKLVANSGALRIRSDVERKRLFGLAPEQRSRPQDEQQLYGSAMSQQTFERLEQLATQIIEAGFAVIVDATFLHRSRRSNFRKLAAKLAVPFVIIDCEAPAAVLRQRLLAREQQAGDASEAGIRVMEKQLEINQAPGKDELAYRVAAHSDEDANTLWQRLRQLTEV